MGIGFWSFIANIFLTIRQKPATDAPPDHRLAAFIGFSVFALLVGTIQGVIQVLDPVEEWLEEAAPSGYLVTPLAHAQLNMVGFAIVGLMTMSLFLLPRILGRPITDARASRRVLSVICVGIIATYAVFLGVGLLESIAIHNGMAPLDAQQAVAGTWGRYALFIGAQAILGIGYFLLFRHIANIIGRDTIRAYFGTFWARMRGAGRQSVRVHPRALTPDPVAAQRRGLAAFLLEALGGGLGFMGMGWIYSGRPFVGIMMLGSWGGGFWTFVYVVLAVAGGDQLLPVLLIPYFTLPVLSGIGCYRSYMRDTRQYLARTA
jgi:hypothetical protein